MEDGLVDVEYSEGAMGKSPGYPEQGAFIEDVLFILKPELHFCIEVIRSRGIAATTPTFKKIKSPEANFNEGLADHFAAQILLPQGLVREKWWDHKDVGELANIFSVPKSVVYLALKTLCLI